MEDKNARLIGANHQPAAPSFYFGSPTVYPYLRPMTRYLCAGVGVVVRILINILAGRECACVCVCEDWAVSNVGLAPVGQPRPD